MDKDLLEAKQRLQQLQVRRASATLRHAQVTLQVAMQVARDGDEQSQAFRRRQEIEQEMAQIDGDIDLVTFPMLLAERLTGFEQEAPE